MEANTSTPEKVSSEPEKHKAPRQRSAAYPSYLIDPCIAFTARIDKEFSSVAFTPQESISKTLDQSGGAFLMLLSSCVQYGLLDKSAGNGYKPSALFKKISKPLPQENVEDLKIECFSNPKLYKALILQYQNQQLPAEAGLANTLDRLHGVVGKAATIAARIFYRNARELKLIADGNILRLNSYIPFVEEKNEENPPPKEQTILLTPPIPETPPALPPATPMKEIPIFLKGKGEAKLLLPTDFTDEDLKRVIKVLTAYVE